MAGRRRQGVPCSQEVLERRRKVAESVSEVYGRRARSESYPLTCQLRHGRFERDFKFHGWPDF